MAGARNRRIASVNTAASAIDSASNSGNGSSCTSSPPMIVLIDVPLQRSNASHSRARSCRTVDRPRGLGRDSGNHDRLRERAADGEANAGDVAQPSRIVGQSHREQTARLDADRRAEDLLRRVIRAPEEMHVGVRGHVMRAPGDRGVVACAQIRGHRDIHLPRGVGSRDDEFVVERAAGPAWQREIACAPLLHRRGREPAGGHRKRQIGQQHGRQWPAASAGQRARHRPPRPRRRRSERVAAGQDVPKCQAENSQVEPERPVVDVIQVVFYTARQVRVAAQVVDLRPAGNSALTRCFCM